MDWSVDEETSTMGETVARLTIPCLTTRYFTTLHLVNEFWGESRSRKESEPTQFGSGCEDSDSDSDISVQHGYKIHVLIV
jgi:hypothetical protein